MSNLPEIEVSEVDQISQVRKIVDSASAYPKDIKNNCLRNEVVLNLAQYEIAKSRISLLKPSEFPSHEVYRSTFRKLETLKSEALSLLIQSLKEFLLEG